MSPFVPRTVNSTAPVLSVHPWPDLVVEAVGHDPRSAYAHEYWLPIVGPSVMAVARKLVERIEAAGGPTDVQVAELAASVGLGCTIGPAGVTRSSRIIATLRRLCQFGLAHAHANPDGSVLFRIRTMWPPLTRGQAARLPAQLLARLDAA